MVDFEYAQYVERALISPLIFFVLIAIVVVMLVFKLIGITRNLKSAQRNIDTKTVLSVTLCSVSMAFAFVALLLTKTQLDTSWRLIFEKPDDSVTVSGVVSEIRDVPFSPRYSREGDSVVWASYVKVNGEDLYFQTADGISVGDALTVTYLPKTRMVLSYRSGVIGDLHEPIPPYLSRSSPAVTVNIVFHIGFLVLFLLSLVMRRKNFISPLAKRVKAEDAVFQGREIRKSPYLIKLEIALIGVVGVVFTALDAIFGGFTSTVIIVIPTVIGIYTAIAYFKRERLEYDDECLTYYPLHGKSVVVERADVLSASVKMIEPNLRAKHAVEVLEITYKKKGAENQTIVFPTSAYVGIRNFMNEFS